MSVVKVDLLDVVDIYEAAETIEYLIELYEMFNGTDVSQLSDYVIEMLLEQEGYEYPRDYVRRCIDDYAVSFHVNDDDTAIGIDYESNVSVSYVVNYSSEKVTIANYNAQGLTVEVTDLND